MLLDYHLSIHWKYLIPFHHVNDKGIFEWEENDDGYNNDFDTNAFDSIIDNE